MLVGVVCAIPGSAHSRRAKTIAFVPDPSCRTSKLVTVIEERLESDLNIEKLSILEKDKSRANILLRYFLIQRKESEGVTIELDGRVFENQSGKLLSEQAATSEPFSDDESGRAKAAEQVAGKLAEKLNSALPDVIWKKGKGRRIMFQVSLDAAVADKRDDILKQLKNTLAGMSLKTKGSTERNLIMVFHTSETTRELVEALSRNFDGIGGLKVEWLVKSDNTLMVRLVGEKGAP